jgi:DnaK suppressor protein
MPKAPKKLTKKDLDRFKIQIEKEIASMTEDVEYIKENAINSNTKESTGDHSAYSYHMADQGTDAQEREKAFLFASRETAHIDRLRNALERIEQGTFGICSSCEGPVGKERLKAVPTATHCVPCKTKQ